MTPAPLPSDVWTADQATAFMIDTAIDAAASLANLAFMAIHTAFEGAPAGGDAAVAQWAVGLVEAMCLHLVGEAEDIAHGLQFQDDRRRRFILDRTEAFLNRLDTMVILSPRQGTA